MQRSDVTTATSGPNSFSLGRFLLWRILGLTLPVVVLAIALHWLFLGRLLRAQFDRGLLEKARVLATLVSSDGERLQLEFADEFMPEYSRAEEPHYFQVWYPDGRPLERSYSLREDELPLRHGSLTEPAIFETVLADGVAVRCVGVEFPARLGHAELGRGASSVTIVVAAQSAALGQLLVRGLKAALLTGCISAAGIALVVWLVLRRGAALLGRVVTAVEGLRPEATRAPRELAGVPLEIRPILDALDGARESIRNHAERERRFTADVAHELRTPIAELRMAADLALRWPDEESRQRLAVEARAIALQMGSLVESLLELASLESEARSVADEDFDLAELVERELVRARAVDRGGERSIELRLSRPCPLRSQARLWEVLVRNLIDNAYEHSSPGAAITLLLEVASGGARLCVSNPTAALDRTGLARCTERLWRARRDPGDTRHFGLGLSLVQAACARLGHELSVELDAGVFRAIVAPSASVGRGNQTAIASRNTQSERPLG